MKQLELESLQSFKPLQGLLATITPDDFQCVDALRAIHAESAILTHSPGMGKTIVASLIIRMLLNEDPTRKFVFYIEGAQSIQTVREVSLFTKASVALVTGEKEVIDRQMFLKDFTKAQILFLTKSSLIRIETSLSIYSRIDEYCGIFVDEAHKTSHFRKSQSAWTLSCLLPNFRYRFALTATPAVSMPEQLPELINMFRREKAPELKKMSVVARAGYNFAELFPNFIIERSRESLGISNTYEVSRVYVNPTEEQKELQNYKSLVFKGEGAFPQVKALVESLRKMEGKTGLVYIHHHKVREFVAERLREEGIDFTELHGRVSSTAEKEKVLDEFRSGNKSVLLTSLKVGLNIDADYVIFYEYCVDISQMLGRAERSRNPKTVWLFYIITRGLEEMEFSNKIEKRSIFLASLLGKDQSSIFN